MNKYLKIFFAFSLLIITKNTYADCTYTDKANLNKLAANVKIDYEVMEKKIDKNTEGFEGEEDDIVLTLNYLNLIFTNVSKELYVTGSEKNNGEEITVFSSDLTDGKKIFTYDDVSFIRKYTFKVMASDESACPGETLKTLYVTLPMRNEFAEYCGDEDKDFYLCKPFITTSIENYSSFHKQYEDYYNKDDKKNTNATKKDKWYNKVLNKLDDYKFYIIGGVAVVGASLIVVKVIKTKKQRELGL